MEESLPYRILDEPWHESISEDYQRAKSDYERNEILIACGVDKAHLSEAKRIAGIQSLNPTETTADVVRDIRSEIRKANKDSTKTFIVAVLTFIATAITMLFALR